MDQEQFHKSNLTPHVRTCNPGGDYKGSSRLPHISASGSAFRQKIYGLDKKPIPNTGIECMLGLKRTIAYPYSQNFISGPKFQLSGLHLNNFGGP